MSKPWEIWVEHAQLRIGPFRVNLSQNEPVSLPPVTPPGGDVSDKMEANSMRVPIYVTCKTCGSSYSVATMEILQELLAAHRGHELSIVP